MESPLEITIIIEHGEKIIIFKECHNGLYYHVVGSDNSTKYNNTVNNYTIVQTIKGKKSYFIKEYIKEAGRVKWFQKVIGWPRNTTLKSIIKNQLIRNIDINIYYMNKE